MNVLGLHHLTAITAKASENHAFYTGTLGMRLVKKTVNQDDTSAYHLFYADGLASPGTDITFFDWPAAPEQRGTNSISRTGLRVAGGLDWWCGRLAEQGVIAIGDVIEEDGRATLLFEDPEGQRLALVDDGGKGPGHPWDRSPVPTERQIRGLGPIRLTVAAPERTAAILTGVLGFAEARRFTTPEGEVRVFSTGEGGPGAEIQLAAERGPMARQGAGGVHHVAFAVPDADYEAWAERLVAHEVRSSGPIDRFYFRSLYFREPNGILFEIATDGPGFTADEPLDSLGEHLSLPPFLESKRAAIESGLKPL